MKDLGKAYVILGIKIIRNSEGITLSQTHYVEKVLKKFSHFDCDPVRTPYDPSIHLKKNRGSPVAQFEYAKIISSVMFVHALILHMLLVDLVDIHITLPMNIGMH